jgi:hypothetical protein
MPLRAEAGVRFDLIAPAGFRILAALEEASLQSNLDLIITSGTDGEHSGPNDPHHLGQAYDVRSHDFSPEQKQMVLEYVMTVLGTPLEQSGGLVTDKFFGWLEAAGTANEHYHFQLRRGMEYP